MREWKVNRKVLQGAVSTVFNDSGIATDGCGTCVGVACSGPSKTVAHFDVDCELLEKEDVITAIKEKTKKILEEHFFEGKSYNWGLVTRSNHFTTKAIIKACEDFFIKDPVINEEKKFIGIFVRKSGTIKGLGFNDHIILKEGGREVDNGEAHIKI